MVHCQPVMQKRVVATLLRNAVAHDKDRLNGKSVCSRLNLENLESFEVVEEQFQQQGVIFRNAIALQPSNTAYPPRAGKVLLMGAPRNGWIELIFKRPIRFFNCHVTSSQPIILSAYDDRDNLLAQDELPQANLANSNSTLPPNASLRAVSTDPCIARITLYAFDGQLTANDLSFGF